MTMLINKETSYKNRVKEILGLETTDFIHSAYELVLHRKPDPTGLQSAHLYFNQGGSKLRYLYKMINSPEAIAAGADKNLARIIKSLYRLVKLPVLGVSIENKLIFDAKQSLKNKRLELENYYINNNLNKALKTVEKAVQPEQNKMMTKAKKRQYKKRSNGTCLWMDLTTTMEWTGGVVGIIRAELEVASALKKIRPEIRYSMQLGNGFIEIDQKKLDWLFGAENVADAYVEKFNRAGKKNESPKRTSEVLNFIIDDSIEFFHPYEPDDIVFCMGWMDSKKEKFFDEVKLELPQLYISYLIYDTILINKNTTQFYDQTGATRFKEYIEWISTNASLVFYGGGTAKIDTENFQREYGWRTPIGIPVQFGTDITKSIDFSDDDEILEKLNLKNKKFVITVGSLEPRKNHETLYKAMLMALEMDFVNTPTLVIVGKPMWRVDDLMNHLTRNPNIKGKIILLRPSDKELSALYRHCLFTLLPSLYEGWSLTLPESLGQGKFCLTCDTPPLVEIGRNMVEYIKPYDVRGWAEGILKFTKDINLLNKYENNIKENWPQTSWLDTAKMLNNSFISEVNNLPYIPALPTIWFDLSLSYLYGGGGISGIVRAELTFARYFKMLYKNIRFFAKETNQIFEIPDGNLLWLFNENDLATAYSDFSKFWDNHELNKTGYRSPDRDQNIDSSRYRIINKFPDNSIIVFTGIDSAGDGIPRRCIAALEATKGVSQTTLSHLVYDFTPFIIPQCHRPETCIGYEGFIKYISNEFDYLVYGGKNSLLDSKRIQAENGWRSPESHFIEFGSDIKNGELNLSRDIENEMLRANDIGDKFIITVGTIEPRKNHEMLYKAYIQLIENGVTDLPQIIFVGKPGWLVGDFLATLYADNRVKNLIKLISPDDTLLGVLYRRCQFTVLASMYEGWSLTLPESLSYGKFCLTADTPPLIETGRDLVEYINPYDTALWGERIMYYYNNPSELEVREKIIKLEWCPKTWKESSKDFLDGLLNYHCSKINFKI